MEGEASHNEIPAADKNLSRDEDSGTDKNLCVDEKSLVLTRLLAAHEAWFDVQRNFEYAGKTFPGFARFTSHGEQFVLVKRAKLWEVDAHELMFFELADHLDGDMLSQLVSFMTTEAVKMVEAKANHMTTYLTLVVIADTVGDDIARAVRTTRFRKNFKLGLHGWADLRLAVVDLGHANVLTNAAGKELKPVLQANAFSAASDTE